jgi:DNA primase
MISKETIDKIFETVRIEEVIGDFVSLKKSGSNYKGLSPFVNEKTPSFMVSPAKQIFKDFSSGKGGNAVSFLMEHEHYTYPEALRYLAKRYNIEIEETGQSDAEKEARSEKESLYLVNDFALRYFQQQLWETETGRKIALSYFKERGFSEDTIKQFALGYSQEEYEAFTEAALKEAYQLSYLEKTGLTKVDGGRRSDRFRGRVMFPILSHTGRVLGFGGRTLKKDAKIAKYLNSPESDIYHKSKTLYGLFQAKSELSKQDECFLVEGYTDVISLHQAGVKNVVASSGTSLTTDQINLIKRYTHNITFLFDGDAAGIKASLRGIDMVLQEAMNVRVVLFPDGEDPDSYAKHHSSIELKEYVAEARQDFLGFKAKLLLDDAEDSALERSRVAREMVQSIALIPDALERDAYVKECARIMQMEERVLFSELAQLRKKNIQEEEKKVARERNRPTLDVVPQEEKPQAEAATHTTLFPNYEQERALCWLMLNYATVPMHTPVDTAEDDEAQLGEETEAQPLETVGEYILLELMQDELHFKQPVFQQFFEAYQVFYNKEHQVPDGSFFMRHEQEQLMKLAVDLGTEKYELHNWQSKKIHVSRREDSIAKYAEEAVLRFKQKHLEGMIKEVQNGIAQQTENERVAALDMIKTLTELRNQAAKALNRIV